ncbi:MAG: XylR family transcriptional regulator [Planctomycetaceae bacterium]|jgi:LacI family transcriptional regulator|nr:XylR family transcriptional regulator [Planctomycetaceae bacterium]
MKKIHYRTPQVAIILELSHEISRCMLRGILKFVRIYGAWSVDFVVGGPQDQRLPNRRYWNGNGIIGRIPNQRVADEVINANLPTVIIDPIDEFLNPKHPLSRCHNIRCDNIAVGQMAADYLLNSHFEQFAFVGEINNVNWSRLRQESFVSKITEAGFYCNVYSATEKVRKDWNIERKFMSRWIQRLPKPLALFAGNDHRARQILDACQLASVPVPYQVAVLGVNNDQLLCEMTQPSLSSVPLDAENAGFNAAQILDQLMRHQTPPEKTLWFSPKQIIVRNSTEQIHVTNKHLINALDFIRINAGMNIRVSDVARHVGVTRQWIERACKHELGHSIMDEIKRIRIQTIRSLVGQTTIPFQEIAKQCGFECVNHLGIIFKKEFGITMSEYRKNTQQKSNESS